MLITCLCKLQSLEQDQWKEPANLVQSPAGQIIWWGMQWTWEVASP